VIEPPQQPIRWGSIIGSWPPRHVARVELQPLSLQGQTGLNLAVGVAALELRYGP